MSAYYRAARTISRALEMTLARADARPHPAEAPRRGPRAAACACSTAASPSTRTRRCAPTRRWRSASSPPPWSGASPLLPYARDAIVRACGRPGLLRGAAAEPRGAPTASSSCVSSTRGDRAPRGLGAARAARHGAASGDDPRVLPGGRARAPRHLPRVHRRRSLGGRGRPARHPHPRRARGRVPPRLPPRGRDGAAARALLRDPAARRGQGHRRHRPQQPRRRHGALHPGAARLLARGRGGGVPPHPQAPRDVPRGHAPRPGGARHASRSSSARCTAARGCAISTCSPWPTSRRPAPPR